MGLHGDDPPVLCPYLLEQREQELAPLGRLGLYRPELGEVVEQRSSAVQGGIGWWTEALDLFLQCLAAHHVLGLGEVAEHIEVLEALHLVEQFGASSAGRLGVVG